MTLQDTEANPESFLQSGFNARQTLLAARTAAGYWEGELSSSALSTATATFAIWLRARDASASEVLRKQCDTVVGSGVRWLIDHQNADGGWGDTTISPSNISTTALCWAAIRAIDEASASQAATRRAETWLASVAGSIQPTDLARAIADRYGKDRTFSAPILTMCALARQLGESRESWRFIPQLPYELAACPQSWFRYLHLPVVSYALPALIAIGRVRHKRRPTKNPIALLVRQLTDRRCLRVLEQIQPTSGGFLEAAPLTSFVVMSLVASGEAEGVTVNRGITFLLRSVRSDGSWPIDTNLAIWVTTLSVNALAASGHLAQCLTPDDREVIRSWLLKQQHTRRHPYTGADAGGWAWTDLPGGVPDADDTAGALVALSHLSPADALATDAACAGVRWLLGVQNADGGIPTFCRGWGMLPFDRSAADLTAHVLLAWKAWHEHLPADLRRQVETAARRAIRYLGNQQQSDGSWVPLWFGNHTAVDDSNLTYGTSRVLPALCAYANGSNPLVFHWIVRGLDWLFATQNEDGGWGAARGAPSTIEETGYALHALKSARSETMFSLAARHANYPKWEDACSRGQKWMVQATQNGKCFTPAPIGLYFAKLWYYERLYPLIASVAALT